MSALDDQADHLRDTAALLRAAADHDDEAVQILLAHSDTREVAKYLVAAAVTAGRITPGLIDFIVDEMRVISQEGNT